MQSKPTHFYWLDLLRFVAAFAVVMCHFRGAFFMDYTSLPVEEQTVANFGFFALTRLGQEAVLIFFVLSGFLVGGRSIEKMCDGTFQGRNYAIDRFVRIMLPLASALLLYIPVTIWRGADIEWANWFGCWFSLQGIYTGACIEQLWSLAYEVWFYIIVLGVYLAISQKWKWGGYLLLIVCSLVFTKLQTHYLLIWMLGAFAYIVRPQKFNLPIFLISILGICGMIVILQYTSGGHVTAGWTSLLPTQNRQSQEVIYAIFCCLFVQQLILLEPKTAFSKGINTLGTKMAAFSYTLYLAHVLVLRSLEYLGAPRSESINAYSVGLWLCWLMVALVVCYMLYLCFEKQTKVVKDRIKYLLKTYACE